MSRVRNVMSLGGDFETVEDYAHLKLSRDTCYYATIGVTIFPMIYYFLWQVHFFMVMKSYHERGLLATQRKKVASY